MAYTGINKSTDYFNTKLYTGNAGTQTIDNGFRSDFLWIKARSESTDHRLFDTIRGTEALVSNTASGQINRAGYGFTSLASNGFTLNGNASGGEINANTETYAAWNWKGNGTTNANNTAGNINSTVNLNTTAGFSIVKWDSTGTAGINIGHGLGQKPAMIIAKCLNQSDTSFPVYHQSLGATKYVSLQATTAATTSATRWNNSEPTTTTFQTGSSGDIGGSNRTMIAYCFAEKQGYSKFGSYTGNGNANGTFVYTGFKPAFVLIKVTSTTNDWEIHDNKRGSSNVINAILQPNLSAAESPSGREIDFLSNGFKLRNTGTQNNGDGGTFIYMAFGQSIVGSNNVPATAR